MKKTISSQDLGNLYAFVHFSIEVACFYFLFSRLSTSPLWVGFALLFDALAFIPQSFIGLIADKYPRIDFGFWGCWLVLAALVIPADIPALVLLCIGNAFAHVRGAQATLTTSGGRIAPASTFVGGGSFGVITGQLLGGAQVPLLILVPLLLMALSLLAIATVAAKRTAQDTPWKRDVTARRSTTLIVLLAFGVVSIRAYIGYAIPTEWRKTAFQAILLFSAMGIGKIAGGFLADRFGCYKTALLSSLLSLPFLLCGNSYMLLSLIGVGLFSMTMPITIAILVSRFPKQPGFAFGVTTVALFAGTFPAFFVRPATLAAHQIVVFILIAVATAMLSFCLERRCRNERNA